MIERTWYYYRDNLQEGPITESALRSLIASHRIPNNVLVHCAEISEEWHLASEVDAFRNLGGMATAFDNLASPSTPPPFPNTNIQPPTRYKTPPLFKPSNPVLPAMSSKSQSPPPVPPYSQPAQKSVTPKAPASKQSNGCLSRVIGVIIFCAVGSAIKSCNSQSSNYTAPSASNLPSQVATAPAPSPAPLTPTYIPEATPAPDTTEVAPPGYTLYDNSNKSRDNRVTVNEYDEKIGDYTLWQFWAVQNGSNSLLNTNERTYYPADFVFTNDSQWLVRIQKTGSGEMSLFLYQQTSNGWVSATRTPLSDAAWSYFKSLPDYQQVEPPNFHFDAELVRGVEDDYKSLNEDWPDSRYLIISLSGDVLPTSTHGQLQSLGGWQCRYDLQNGTFDVPVEFANNNAKALLVAPTPPPLQSSVTPTVVAPPPQSFTVMDETGKSYTVSPSDYQILQQMKARMAPLLNAINKLQAKQEQDNKEIDSERAVLDSTDQLAVDRFNAFVDAFNADKDTLDREIDDYNARVKEHNDYLLKVGTPTY
jgi:hypothetical protein